MRATGARRPKASRKKLPAILRDNVTVDPMDASALMEIMQLSFSPDPRIREAAAMKMARLRREGCQSE